MAFTAKPLADGQVSNVLGPLYTVPGGSVTAAYIKFFSIYNTSATTQNVTIYVNVDGANDRAIARVSLDQDGYARIIDKDESMLLEPGDIIKAVTTTDAVVDFTIQGIEETS